MIDAIRASFKKGLPNLDWMDDKTRRAAEDKVMLIDLNLADVTLGSQYPSKFMVRQYQYR